MCLADSDEKAVEMAHEWWPNSALPGQLSQELATPTHFEEATQMVTEEDVEESDICSSDPQDHIEYIESYIDVGYDHVYIHQIGPNQSEFIDTYESDVLPTFS